MADMRAAGLLVTLAVGCAHAYNVDVDSSVVFQGPIDSMFGFSVAAYSDSTEQWALVGAPQADTPQPGVARGGAVYKCSVEPPTEDSSRYRVCQQIPFDLNGNNVASNRTMDDKSGQWFGATVIAAPGANNSGVVVACAPRYLWFSSNRRRREPVGTCYVAKDGFAKIEEYSPCRTDAWGYHRLGFCQAGLGSAISKAGDRLFIGAVGSWYWQGRLFSQHLYSRPDLAGTKEGSSADDDSYLGYSVAAGEFDGDLSQDVAVGMPRGNNLTGKVLLYTALLKPLVNISGEQIGAYFGYALAVADVNGDGLDDLVVGAPLHTDFTSTEGKYETGQVVVAYQSAGHKFDRTEYLHGQDSKSRFGLALTSLGDVDLDGFDDVAVGAPHDGSGEDGRVYIFHGTRAGIGTKPTQVISASSLGLANSRLLSLGFSVRGGLDLDGNQYPDLLIGAHDSSAAVYLRSRPVVHVRSSVKYQTGPQKLMDLGDTTALCFVGDVREVPCVSVLFCLEYDGVGADKRAEFEVQFRLDARRPKAPRMFFVDQPGQSRLNVTARADRERLWCHERYVYVEKTVRDKLTPLVTEVHYSLVYRKPSSQRSLLQPVLNLDTPPLVSDAIAIQKNCGTDNVCVPDLQLQASTSHSTYLLGSRERLTLDVIVFNINEDAFEAMFFLDLPVGVDFVGTELAADSLDLPVLCTLVEAATETLSCDLGNPLPGGSRVHFFVYLMPESTSEELQQHYRLNMSVNTTNAEKARTERDNEVTLTLPIRIHTELIVTGISLPESVHYSAGHLSTERWQHERQVGPELYHVYELSNRGPSDIIAAEAYILWPTYTLPSDQHLLYLLEQPRVEGPGSCELVPGVNPLQLQLESAGYQSSTAQSRGVSGGGGTAEVAPIFRSRRDSESEFQAALGCGPTICTKIYCKIGKLADKQNVIIRVRSRLWAETIEKETKHTGMEEVYVSSKMVARVTELPHKVDPSYMNHTSYAVTSLVLSDEVRSEPVPWWVIVLASCGGVLILLLLVLVLYRLGFFKRKRRPDTAGSGGGGAGGGANGKPSYYGYQSVPYRQAGDEAL